MDDIAKIAAGLSEEAKELLERLATETGDMDVPSKALLELLGKHLVGTFCTPLGNTLRAHIGESHD